MHLLISMLSSSFRLMIFHHYSRVSLYDNAFIQIGDRVLLGPGVCICTATHQADPEVRKEHSGTSFARPIIIESDCWIGARATILDGVRIGKGTTIAAGAVVTCDIEAGCLAGGVPAKVIRRFAKPEDLK